MFIRVAAVFAAAVVFSVTAFAADTALLGGKASVTLPAELVRLSAEAKKKQYPDGKGPQDVFANTAGTVSFSATTQPGSKATLDVLVSTTARDLGKTGIVTAWGNKGVKTIGDRDFGYVEFKAKGTGGDTFSHVYFTKRGNELVVFTVSASAALLKTWGAKLNDVVESTKVVVC